MRIFTIGFTQKSAEEFFGLLTGAGVKKVVVVMEHTAKDGPKLLKRCTLPLTGSRVVDLVITDLGVFEIDKHGHAEMRLLERAPGVTVEEIRGKTEAAFSAN